MNFIIMSRLYKMNDDDVHDKDKTKINEERERERKLLFKRLIKLKL